MFSYQIELQEKSLILYFKGSLDIEVTEMMYDRILPSLHTYKHIVINFQEVEFVDSTGIGLLIEMVQELHEQNTNISIVEVSESIKSIFELLQLSDILGENVLQ
ncbi:STAS domain-containing protein [Bacillus tianshenii]|nr:STAS domain-containing protein [Bacillus tianshenii]